MSRVTIRWESNFARFIQSYGVELLALKLEVHPTAIYHWVRGATTPRPAYAEAILKLASQTGFDLTMDEVYAHARNVRPAPKPSPCVSTRKSKLEVFIHSYGVESLAEQLDRRPSTICSWIRGDAAPNEAHVPVIQQLALERGFRLTMNDIRGRRAQFR